MLSCTYRLNLLTMKTKFRTTCGVLLELNLILLHWFDIMSWYFLWQFRPSQKFSILHDSFQEDEQAPPPICGHIEITFVLTRPPAKEWQAHFPLKQTSKRFIFSPLFTSCLNGIKISSEYCFEAQPIFRREATKVFQWPGAMEFRIESWKSIKENSQRQDI